MELYKVNIRATDVPIFRPVKFRLWKDLFMGFLKTQNLDRVLNPNADQRYSPHEQETARKWIWFALQIALKDYPIPLQKYPEQPKQLWDHLERTYGTVIIYQSLDIQRQLTSFRWKPEDTVQSYVDRLDEIYILLAQAGRPVDEMDRIASLVRTLPREHSNGIQHLIAENNYDIIVRALHNNEARLKSALVDNVGNEEPFLTISGEVHFATNNKRRRLSTYSASSPPPPPSSPSTTTSTTCEYCMKNNHPTHKCFKRRDDRLAGIVLNNINDPRREDMIKCLKTFYATIKDDPDFVPYYARENNRQTPPDTHTNPHTPTNQTPNDNTDPVGVVF